MTKTETRTRIENNEARKLERCCALTDELIGACKIARNKKEIISKMEILRNHIRNLNDPDFTDFEQTLTDFIAKFNGGK